MGLVARQRGGALNEIEDAFRRVPPLRRGPYQAESNKCSRIERSRQRCSEHTSAMVPVLV